ncbi:GGDEF domain-containing protein [Lacticaseibacillus sp. GG6-2]
MIQQAIGDFFLVVASTLGFITAYTQIDDGTRKTIAAKRSLSPIVRELPVVIYICAILLVLRIASSGFQGQIYWMLINLQIIILLYSNLLVPTFRAFLVVQVFGAVIFESTGSMDWFSWLFYVVAGVTVFGERWYGRHFKHYQLTYMLPAALIGAIFWVMIAVRFAKTVPLSLALLNLFSFCWAYFALDRYDQDQHEDQRVLAKLTHETQYDGLTQVRNWTTFQEDFNVAFEDPSDLGLITLDIDHFKAINDTYGHLVGNQALMVVATTLSQYLKLNHPSGHIYRTGGEEFTIILPKTDLTEATSIVLACQQQLRQAQIRFSSGEFYLSASFGLAEATAERTGDATGMFKRADHYLYQSKRRGRNCVTIEGKTMTAMANDA